jgi:hypothetical protein
MTCGAKLGEHTIAVVGSQGVLGLWCRGECLQDMHAVGFLSEVMDSITDAIEQREKPSSSNPKGGWLRSDS